jgi:hypothetical protein
MRKRTLLGNNTLTPDPITDPTLTNPLDICFYNSATNDLEFYGNSDAITLIENSEFRDTHTPIGIVVVPGSHDRYGIGQGGAIMSLKPMSYSDPDNGATSETTMYWGYNSLDISGLTNYNNVITTSSKTTNTESGGLSSTTYAYIPRQGSVDGTPTRNRSPYAPSPYVGSDYKSGGSNALYSTTASDSGSDRNVLADFDGQKNTATITSLSESWKTGAISNSYDTAGVYPAAQTCARYKTVGTKSGEWYLPAAGELGYIVPRLYDINATISALITKYGAGVGVQLSTGNNYWSSSEYNSNYAYRVYTDDGGVYGSGKDYSCCVRAFRRIKPKPIGSDAAPLSVLFAKSDGSMTIQPSVTWPDASTGYTPIGIVVIPGEHDVYGNGTCGVMSLKPMSYSDPDNGATSETGMFWGGFGTDISVLTNYTKVITTSSNTTNTESGGLSSDSYAFIPKQNAVDGTPTRDKSPYAPSPYVGSDYKSGGPNALYSTTASDSGSNRNMLADFGGIANTKIITDLATAQSNWKTDSTITNNSGAGYYPAACCCARYKTVGTKSGEWYLPAAGELGYIVPRLYDINATISALNTKYGAGVGVQLYALNLYWSSSEYDNFSAYYVSTSSGGVNGSHKNDSYCVRAFLRV